MIMVLIHGLAMGFFLLLGWLFPRNESQSLLNQNTFVNIATGLAIFIVAKPVMVLLQGTLQFHIFQLPFDESWAHFLVAFLLLDFSRYWLHFAHHRINWFWSFHRVHHSSETLDATSGLRMHVVDFLQLAMLPILWFGIVIDTTHFASWVIPSALGVGVLMDAFQHANIKMDMTKPWNRAWHMVFNNPHFHVWHHTREGPEIYGNYGNTLLIWDRLFGTEITQPHVPPSLGISTDQALENSPLGLQLLRRRT